MILIHYLSILLEIIVAIMGYRLYLKKKFYGLGIFITFGIYVIYDLAKLLSLSISTDLLYLLFFVASISAFLTVRQLSINKK